MKTQAALEQRTDGRFRVTNLGWDRFYAEGATREEAEQKFRAVWVKSEQSRSELIWIDSDETEAAPDAPVLVGDLLEWQAARGILSDDDNYAAFMEGVQRRRAELDEMEERWRNSS